MEYFFFSALVLYLAPWVLAEWLERDDAMAILAATLLTGWTGIGWVVCLVWAGFGAFSEARRQRRAPDLAVVAGPVGAETRSSSGSRRVALALGVAGLLGVGVLGLESLSGDASLGTQRVAGASLSLRAGPQDHRAVVGVVPQGCVLAVMESRGSWQRVWRTQDCPDGASGRAGGWTRSF